jgi:hypothetical protein
MFSFAAIIVWLPVGSAESSDVKIDSIVSDGSHSCKSRRKSSKLPWFLIAFFSE